MKKFFYSLGTVLIVAAVAVAGWWVGENRIFERGKPVETTREVIEKPLEKYAIENLAKAQVPEGELKILDDNLFEFYFNPNLDGKTIKKTTGQIRIPEGKGPFPIVLMLRGYVDQEIYQTGVGTSRAAAVFVKNGFITLAPDFLGYAGSNSESGNIFEARFQTYTTAISLYQSLHLIDQWDGKNIFIWGHSNGGQIALTLLEATGVDYPTTLWAPVSKPFPYSILYYTDESDDKGKLIRRELAKFEDLYDTDLFSIHSYYDRINAQIQLHQGTDDDAVPISWSDALAQTFLDLDLDLDYYKYPGADHNLQPSWNTVVERDLQFFSQYRL